MMSIHFCNFTLKQVNKLFWIKLAELPTHDEALFLQFGFFKLLLRRRYTIF